MIMNVAVPLPKHSPMFGHDASSQTVCRWCSRRICLISWKRGDDGARTRIQSACCSALGRDDLDGDARGLGAALVLDAGGVGRRRRRVASPVMRPPGRSVDVGTIRASPMRQQIGASSRPARSTLRATPRSRELGDRKARIAAGIDVGERREIHRDVDRQAMIRAAVAHLESQRRDLRLDAVAQT